MNHSLELVKADNDPTLLVNQILPAFIIIPGVIGNMLATVTIISSPMLRQRTASIILLVLYIVDTCVLCSGCSLVQWVVNLANIDLIAASGANQTLNNTTDGEIIEIPQFNWVILVFVFHYVAYTLSGFLVTLLTVERFYAVSQPLTYRTLAYKKERLYLLISLLLLVAFLIYLPILLDDYTVFYWNPRSGNMDMIGMYPRLSTSISLFACSTICIPTNIGILYYFRKMTKNKKKMVIKSHGNNEDDAMNVKMTIILLGISFAFLLLTIPNRIFVVVIFLKKIIVPEIVFAISIQLFHFNFGINSVFYFFVSKEARQELQKVVSG